MKLLELTISDFRGFGSNGSSIMFDDGLTLVYGPNGYGKSSIAEAIEWLFYGATKRRQLGEAYSKTEYAGTYGNVHRTGLTSVSAKVKLADGSEHTVTRMMPLNSKDETNHLIVDGSPATFSDLGFSPSEPAYPVVTQHSLQTFIHIKPKERRDAVGAALGLEELTTLKSALDGARRSFNLTPPSSVTAARAHLKALAPVLMALPELSTVAANWALSPAKVNITSDIAALVKAAQRITDSTLVAPSELLGALRDARREAGRSVFDISKVAPTPMTRNATALLSGTADVIRVKLQAAENAANWTIATTASTYSAELLAFWETGLRLSKDGDTCPMCESPTLTTQQREVIRGRVAAHTKVVNANTRLTTSIEDALRVLTDFAHTIQTSTLPDLVDGEWVKIKTLMAGAEEPFARVQESLAIQAKSGESLRESVEALRATLATLPQTLAQPDEAETALEGLSYGQNHFAQVLEHHISACRQHDLSWEAFAPVVSARIADTDLVAEIDAVGRAIKGKHQLDVLACYDAILKNSKLLMQRTEGHLQATQSKLLKARGAEVQRVYDILNPGASVGFEDMEPASDQIRLHARSYGVRMSAAANLSQCQLNCLGLAVWIMRATTIGSPFGFIVLDDPIQSMDDDHSEAFLAALLPHLMDSHGKQVILLSHVQDVIDRTAALYTTRSLRVYHLDSYNQSGPVVTEQIKPVRMLAEIKRLSDGNEDYRSMAVNKLRILVEIFIRELYLKKMQAPAPKEYDSATATKLMNLFGHIPGTTVDEHSRLIDTIGFSDPAHHSEVGYSVPQKSNIQPHIQRLEGLLRKYKLIS